MNLCSRARLRPALAALLFFGLAALPVRAAGAPTGERPQVAAEYGRGVTPFTMAKADLVVEWAVDRDHEVACGGPDIAGGSTAGDAVFSHLGNSTIQASAAWDLGNLIDDPQYDPVGPAGGPVAPVMGPDAYPYQFHFNPETGECGEGPVATGEVRITAANGDEVYGGVQGGEAHRLDFNVPGDGVESFVEIEIAGGTGRFEDATGSFVMHTIIRFDPAAGHFVVDLAEVFPGGTLSY